MTLAQRLAEKVAPCLKGTHAAHVPFKPCSEKPWVSDVCAGCHYRPAFQDAIEDAIRACADLCDEWDDWRRISDQHPDVSSTSASWMAGTLAAKIRDRLTDDEVTP